MNGLTDPGVAFVGLGYASQALHLPAVRALAGASVVSGVDPDAARPRSWEPSGAGPSNPTLAAMLEQVRPDVTIIAAPPQAHAELCVQALRAGSQVLCEKPFVEDLRQADLVLAVAAECGRHLAVNQEFRFMPIFSPLIQAIGRPGVGRPVFVSCVQFMDLAPWEEKVPWRSAMPHRSLFEAGVHLLDLLQAVAGRPPLTVSAHTSAGLDLERKSDAIHLVTLDYGDGLLAQVTIDRLCKSGTRYLDLRVDCEHASLRASYGGRAYLQVGVKRAELPGLRLDYGREGLAWLERGRRRRVLARNARGAAARATGALLAETVSAWRDGREPPVSGRSARDVLALVEAAYRSAETGERVELAEDGSGRRAKA
ncbi:MAG: Gfo/Idh/MocA family protein [Acidimicrobiia bacterium]